MNNANKFNIQSLFGAKWLSDIINYDKKYHPIMVPLSDSIESSKLSKNLRVIENKCNKFSHIIKKIKNEKDDFNFFSKLSEIEVAAYYYRKYESNQVEYEPSVKGGKNLDLKLNINDEVYFFEIFTVFKDAEQTRFEKINLEIKEILEQIQMPFIINFMIKTGFKKSYISDFAEFIANTIDVNKDQENNVNSFKFYKFNKEVAKFRYYHSKTQFIVANYVGPSKFVNPSERIAERILKKSREQIPKNQKNIIVVNLSYVLPVFLVMDPVNKFGDSNNISMAIAYLNNDYSQKKFYPNPNLNNKTIKRMISDTI